MNVRVYFNRKEHHDYLDTSSDWSFRVQVDDLGHLIILKLTDSSPELAVCYPPGTWVRVVDINLDPSHED